MPTHLKQHMKRLRTIAENSTDDAHCSLRHHHYAMICHNGRCISIGTNKKSCSLHRSDGRERRKEKQGNTNRACRGRCHRPRARQPAPPIAYILPYCYTTPPKAKLCRHVKTMRKL